jgi:hypothetical protein
VGLKDIRRVRASSSHRHIINRIICAGRTSVLFSALALYDMTTSEHSDFHISLAKKNRATASPHFLFNLIFFAMV